MSESVAEKAVSFAARALEGLRGGVLGVDGAGRLVLVNSAARRLLGGRVGPELGAPLADALVTAPELIAPLRAAAAGRASAESCEVLLASLGDAAPSLALGVTTSTVRAEGGLPDGALLVFHGLRQHSRSAARKQPIDIVAESSAMQEALRLARRIAPARSTVLITGETGTGKEVVAAYMHALSPRSAAPFVKVNCAALPETLLESELFGHERGAFTGADRRRIGRFEEASGGTLLLDEIGDLSPATQAKLLRVLQEQEFHRLGGTQALRTDARILAATNRDIEARMMSGEFREDLYYRLNVIGLHLQPLRDRPEDAVALAQLFLEEFARELERPVRCFSQQALERIWTHRWPGNVRELRNAVERAVLLSDQEQLQVGDLMLDRSPRGQGSERFEPSAGSIDLQRLERSAVETALQRTGFVQKEAALLLGVSRRKLNYMIQKLGLTHPSWRRNRAAPTDDGE